MPGNATTLPCLESRCVESMLFVSFKTGQVKVVRAMFKYTAMQNDELSFEEGDTLYITDMSDPNGWWKAKCNGQVGLIPSNYGL